MAWNEPGGNNNNQQDPWGGGNRNDGPPDLDEALKKFQEKLNGIFGGGGSSSGGGQRSGGFGLIGVILAVFALLYLAMGIYQLDQQERAVVLRFGKFHSVETAGLHWNWPIIDRVYVENVTATRLHTVRGEMLTEDENIVEVNLSVQYNISDLKNFLLEIRSPEQSLKESTDSALRHVVGGSKMDDVLTVGREQIAQEVKQRLTEYLNDYKTGIQVLTVNVEKTQPPAEVQAAFDDVIKAREDEQRVQNLAQAYANQVVPEARGKAKRILQEAQAYRDEVIARSEGEAVRFEKLLAEYEKAREVTRERLYLDTVQQVMQNSTKVMIDVEGGNNLMYLPLDQLTRNAVMSGGGDGAALQGLTRDELDQIKQLLEQLKRERPVSSRRREER